MKVRGRLAAARFGDAAGWGIVLLAAAFGVVQWPLWLGELAALPAYGAVAALLVVASGLLLLGGHRRRWISQATGRQ